MKNRQTAWGWFAALRRDRVLFAIAGTLVLLSHIFQPWAEARAANTANAWVICTTFGMQMGSPDGKKLPPAGAADDCPQCIGACGGIAAKQRLPAVAYMAFPAPVAFRHAVVSFHEDIPSGRLNEPPPAIRAPPSTAA
ncbi:hypothetical protein SAMN04488498_102460 [Mesorhizobium albiziae]|uniref:DUF2946 domain-containing protein n=1 Tax=Neomesorhizobium albiziae TaxID=335020 RepID=A0A1I3WS16_9HYPH|nr:hypothetical protein [Mesorhizobium albiziae]GLS31856.1 hypothetical protein GCM10007937_35660 [Mesorhizobium albiziae]SFK10328.1 hypothetical protein SAMN04488498_102460 [Mesorhizobium albiziae]